MSLESDILAYAAGIGGESEYRACENCCDGHGDQIAEFAAGSIRELLAKHLPRFTADQPTAADDGCAAYYEDYSCGEITAGVIVQPCNGRLLFICRMGDIEINKLSGRWMVFPQPDATEDKQPNEEDGT